MPECCADIVIDYGNLWHYFSWLTLDVVVFCSTLFQALIVDNFGILALFQMLIADSFDILALCHVLFLENVCILALFQALIADNFGIFNTLGKNKHHPGHEPMTSDYLLLYPHQFTETFVYKKRHSM